jgi:hypothetical protein
MLYVSRDSQGNISELHPMPVGAAKEGLEADNPEVLQFIHERWRQNELTSLDRDFVRVIEDTLELLMAKDLILFTDLPGRFRKTFRRREIRQQTNYNGGYADNDSDIIGFN